MAGPEMRERILQATYACVGRWGLSKTTVEDVAREAGVSRATLYRYFPGGREELLDAVVAWEYQRFFNRLYDEVHDAATLEEVLERAIPLAHRAIVGHEVLAKVMVTDPEILMPKLSVEGERIIGVIAEVLEPYLDRHGTAPGVDRALAADFLARMVLSYTASPGRWDLDDPVQVRQLVRAEALAGIVANPGGSVADG